MKELQKDVNKESDNEKNTKFDQIKQNKNDQTDEPVILMTEMLGVKLTTNCETPHVKHERIQIS